jgi:ribonuclease-3
LSRHAALEERLGHRFSDARLLEQALTHRSRGADNNERLEFLGDGVLGCAVADELYARFPQLSEGKLTRLRGSLVREEALAEIGKALGMERLLRLGEGELAAGPEPRPSILADAVEAVLGAVFLDGGYAAARSAVLAVFGAHLDRLDPERPAKDAKTRLQELLQARYRRLPVVCLGRPEHVELLERCRAAGVDDSLSKPVDSVALLAHLSALGLVAVESGVAQEST